VPGPFPIARLNALQAAVKHSHKQETDDVSHTSNILKVAENFGYAPDIKNKMTFWNSWHFAKPKSIQRHRFISITSNAKFSWQYRKGNQVVRSGLQYTEIEGGAKNIIDSIDHILNHNLVCEVPAAANFVAVVERHMQEILEEFNIVVLSFFWSNIGEDNEVCFPSYKNNKKKQVEKCYKGIAG
jgi:hypothetical protein